MCRGSGIARGANTAGGPLTISPSPFRGGGWGEGWGACEALLRPSLHLERGQLVRLRLDDRGQERLARVEVAFLQSVGGAQGGGAASGLAGPLLPLDQH